MKLVQNTIFNGIKIVLFYAFIGLLVGKLIAYVFRKKTDHGTKLDTCYYVDELNKDLYLITWNQNFNGAAYFIHGKVFNNNLYVTEFVMILTAKN